MAKDNTYNIEFNLSNGSKISGGQITANGGLDALTYSRSIVLTSVPAESSEQTEQGILLTKFSESAFNRHPINGDMFVFAAEFTDADGILHTYLICATMKITGGMANQQLVLFNSVLETTGLQGPIGATGPQGVRGATGPQGPKGEKGDPFAVAKIFQNVTTMQAAAASDDVKVGAFVVIDTGNVNDADNAKLYVKAANAANGYTYLTDLSGAQGMQGPQGIPGQDGENGITPTITASATVGNTVGTPSVTVSKSGTDTNPSFKFAFANLKGATGATGPKGATGATGATGPQGPQGVSVVGVKITLVS